MSEQLKSDKFCEWYKENEFRLEHMHTHDAMQECFEQGQRTPSPSAQKVIDAVAEWKEHMIQEAQLADVTWPTYFFEENVVEALTAYQKERQ